MFGLSVACIWPVNRLPSSSACAKPRESTDMLFLFFVWLTNFHFFVLLVISSKGKSVTKTDWVNPKCPPSFSSWKNHARVNWNRLWSNHGLNERFLLYSFYSMIHYTHYIIIIVMVIKLPTFILPFLSCPRSSLLIVLCDFFFV
jgi:hypothetical protein